MVFNEFKMKKILVFPFLVLLLSACASRVHYVGKNLDKEDIARIKVGQHTKQDVAQILGSPTLSSMFQNDRWYYASKITETKAFLSPVVSEQNVYIITFGENGTVNAVKHLGLEDAKNVSYVGRETPTTGQDTSILQQLFGNFGKITRSDKVRPN